MQRMNWAAVIGAGVVVYLVAVALIHPEYLSGLSIDREPVRVEPPANQVLNSPEFKQSLMNSLKQRGASEPGKTAVFSDGKQRRVVNPDELEPKNGPAGARPSVPEPASNVPR